MRSKKIQAFTIIELIMTMLISSVIIGIVYYVYMLFSHQFSNYREKANAIDEYLILKKAFQEDIDAASTIKTTSDNEVVCLGRPMVNEVHYIFNQENIIRSTAGTQDTFHIKKSGYEAFPVNNSDLIETLVVNINLANEPFSTTYKKMYSASQLMQQPSTNE